MMRGRRFVMRMFLCLLFFEMRWVADYVAFFGFGFHLRLFIFTLTIIFGDLLSIFTLASDSTTFRPSNSNFKRKRNL